jgi:opacity protein-like surface antigen
MLRLTTNGLVRPCRERGFDMPNLRPIAMLALFLLLPAAALAGDDGKKDFGHSGFYLGVGGAYAFNFFEDMIEDEVEDAGFKISLKDTWGVNARVGYRVASWFAVEGMYEWMNNFEIEVDDVMDPGLDDLLGAKVDYRTHTFTVNAKFVIPTWRLQPYLYLGIGGQYYDLNASGSFEDVGLDFSEKGWAFAGRPGAGLDAYITEHILVKVEVAGVLATSNPSTIPDIGDMFYMTVGAGLQYRF